MDWYTLMTTGLLPAPIRAGYRLRFGRVERALYRASLAGMRPVVRGLPRRLRYFPAYLEAEARLGVGPAGAQRGLGGRVRARILRLTARAR